MSIELRPYQFVGGDDEVWSCRVTVNTLIEAARDLDISLADFNDIDHMNLGKLLGFVWYSVKEAAKVRRVTKAVFQNEILTFKNMNEAISALAEAIKSSFPQAEDAPEVAAKGDSQASDDPLVKTQMVPEELQTRGALKTSLS